MARSHLLALAGMTGLFFSLALACQSSNGPTEPAATSSAPLETPYVPGIVSNGVTTEFTAGVFRLELDPTTPAASLTPLRMAQAQPPQNFSYDFDINQFLNKNNFWLNSISVTNNLVYVSLSHFHPFPAPNFANPVSGVNRADLGYTGRLVVLTDGGPQAFFNQAAIANPTLLANADGYMKPGNILAAPRLLSLNTTYPYVLLADEAKNNRSISNGDDPRGNYDPVMGGWQRSNMGAANNEWTGYDYLHQGQSVYLNLNFHQAALQGPTSLDLAILIKYTDPRGAGGATNRLPAETADVADFAYRLPYAALDCSVISFGEALPLTIGAGVDETATITVRVRDWDSAATEAATVSLSAESDVSVIQKDASGLPEVELEVPGLFGGQLELFATGSHSGIPGDELSFVGTITNDFNPSPGAYWGLIRVTDPEHVDPDAHLYRFGVDPDTLLGYSFLALERQTYQAVPINVGITGPAPTITQVTPMGAVGNSVQEVTFTASASGQVAYYSWVFPEGGVEGEAFTSFTTRDHTRRLSRPGTYVGYVYATNNDGRNSPAFPFIFVVENPLFQVLFETPIDVDATLTDANGISSLLRGTRAEVAVTDGTAHTLSYFRATKNVPDSPADWVKIVVDASEALDTPQIALFQNRPVIVYGKDGAVASKIAISNVEAPMVPGDWTVYTLPAGVAEHSNIVVTGNRLMFSCRHAITGRLNIVRATAAEPSSAGDWNVFEPLVSTEIINPPVMALASHADYARVAYTLADNSLGQHVTYEVSPRFPESWVASHVRDGIAGPNAPRVNALLVRPTEHILGFHNLATADNHFLRSLDFYPINAEDWEEVRYQNSYYEIAWMGWAGERLVGTIRQPGPFYQTYLLIALTDQPGEADFVQVVADAESGSGVGGAQAHVTLDNGEPTLLFLYAAGEHGFRQTSIAEPWAAGQ